MPACPRCKTPLEPDARFCGSCGTQLPGGPVPTSQPALTQLDQLVGRTLNGRYRVDRKIGEGGFGAVFEGVHLQMSRPVAIKVLQPSLTRDPQMTARFRREAQAACALRDPHTVTTYDFDESAEGALYITMELIRGRSLLEEIERTGPLPPARAVALVEQVCSALAEAHAREIVHRDIKPENILIEDRPSQADFIKVVDFGIARMMHDPAGETIARLTSAGQIFGTLDYMSPEQVAGGEVDNRTDIYALGAMLYQMLTGAPPFTGTPSQLIAAHLSADPAPPSSRRPELAGDMDRIILRCLAKVPGERYPDVQSLRSDLKAALTRAPTDPAPPLGARAAQIPAPGTEPPATKTPDAAPHQAPSALQVPPTVLHHTGPGPGAPATRRVAHRPAFAAGPKVGIPAGVWIAIAIATLLVLGVGGYAIYATLDGGGGGGGGGSAAMKSPEAPRIDWSGDRGLFRLVPSSRGVVLFLRPAQLMRLPGMQALWRQRLATEAREMTAKLNIGPAQMEQLLIVIPRLPEQGDPDTMVAVRGVNADEVLRRIASSKPETETYLGHTLHRLPDVTLVKLDDRTLVGGPPGTIKQGLAAASAGGPSPIPLQDNHLALLQILLDDALQQRGRQMFQLKAGGVSSVLATLTDPAPDLELVAALTTDSIQTARHVGRVLGHVLRSQRDPLAVALLRRARVSAQSEVVRIGLRAPAEQLITMLPALAAQGGASR